MSSFLNNLFFIQPKNKPILERLRKYMFYKDVSGQTIPLAQPCDVSLSSVPEHVREIITQNIAQDDSNQLGSIDESEPILENTIREPEPEPETEPIQTCTPTQQDTLFWCIYIANHGYAEYLQITRNYGVKELEIKKQVADHIQKNPTKMKQVNTKITKIMIQEILSELLTSQKETSLLCLYGLVVFYTMNVILVDPTERFMLEFISDTSAESPTFVLYKDTYGKYKINTQPLTLDQISELRTKMTSLENYTKPLKAVSQYKLSELEDLAKKIGIYNETKKYKKNGLYEELAAACMWR
uniref:Uncharacterized protein n=1 Tax=viral metagenome TaxID=1070528 RepID=A0A6C0DPJ3_9ZZZZ